jgi:hypothetical protein
LNKIIGILTKTVSVIWLVYINSTTNKFFKQPVINIGKPKYISIGPKDDHQKQKALLIQYEWAHSRVMDYSNYDCFTMIIIIFYF